MILYLSMCLGILLVLLGKLNKVWVKPDFAWKIFFRTNIISFLITIVSGLILVLNQAELLGVLKQIVPNFPFVTGGLFSAILGAGGVTLFQYLVDLANPKKKTAVGFNKE